MNREIDQEKSHVKSFTFNRGYSKSKAAGLKYLQVLFSLLAFFCVALTPKWPASSYGKLTFFALLCQCCMWSTIIIYILVLLNLHHRSWWVLAELVYHCLAAILYLISSIIVFTSSDNQAIITAGVFGIVCFILFGAAAFLCSKEYMKDFKRSPTEDESSL